MHDSTATAVVAKSGLKKHLRAFVSEALDALENARVWPRDPADPLGPLGSTLHDSLLDQFDRYRLVLHDLETYKVLSRQVLQGDLQSLLHDIGYQWVWHGEVLPDLFLEQLLRRSYGFQITSKQFNQVFASMIGELTAPHLDVREVLAVYGFPRLTRPVELTEDVRLVSGAKWGCANLVGGAP